MTLPWVRLDTGFPRNHKILALLGGKDGHRTAFAYVCGLSYSGEQGTDGFIPREALPFIHCRPADAQRLVDARLWWAEPGGWVINGWAEFQPSSDENKRRSDKARLAAAARWDKKRNAPGNAPGSAAPDAQADAREQSTYGRTDGLTENPPSSASIVALSNARTGNGSETVSANLPTSTPGGSPVHPETALSAPGAVSAPPSTRQSTVSVTGGGR